MAIIRPHQLSAAFTSFNGMFQRGLGVAPNDHLSFVTETTSTTSEEEYPWLGEMPGMRKWVGDRVLNNLREYGFKIRNEDFEDTVQVPANLIADDRYNTYGPRFEILGRAVAAHPCELSYAALLAGFSTLGYDGKPLFANDHPVLDANGSMTAVSNFQGGAGRAWFLIATRALVKPIILQRRQAPQLRVNDDPQSPNVFMRKQIIYGVDDRKAAAPGLWQVVYASRQPLTAANYAAARAAIGAVKGDYGRPLGLVGDLLLCSMADEQAGLKILRNENGPGGESNEWQGTATLQASAWLAQ
jgi:phage major head subunit gpT-like protein